MKANRILIVANTTWNIYNFRLNIVRKLIAEGHEVIVLAPVDKYISYTEMIREVSHVPMHHMRRNSINPINDLMLFFELMRLYRKVKPDLILHYTVKCNIYGGLAARLLRIPSVAVVSGVGHPMIHQGWLNTLVKSLYRMTLPWHQKVVFENQDDKAFFDNAGLTHPNQSVSIKGCGVDMDFFKPAGDWRNGQGTTFSFIGRLIYDKGVKEFIEAAQLIRKKYSNVQFWLVGDIDEGNPSSVSNEDLMYWIRDPYIHYHGATDQVKTFFEKSDCIVLPSYRGEGLPKVIMEAMAMERPVITTDTPGCREAVEDGVTGYLVSVQNTEAIVKAMEDFIRLDHDERIEMGRRGRRKALKEFDEKIIVDQLYGYFNGAGDKGNPPA
ncbi:MAG TPA: glycosyltransferase family 4 protein [Saprospiraceae bacterium]|nr:glycosyltransferase family 4 protein [Saprospiraceae bacterium]